MRDIGAAQFCLLEGVLPREECVYTGENVLIKLIGCFVGAPLYRVNLKSLLETGEVTVTRVLDIPNPGVRIFLANDLCGDKVLGIPVVCEILESWEAYRAVGD